MRKGLHVWYRNVTTARILDRSLVPSTLAGGLFSKIQSKIVDFVLMVEPNETLHKKILQTLAGEVLSHTKKSINHVGAEYLRFKPVAIGVETKRAAVDEDEACVLLSLWVSAHFACLRELSSAIEALLVLPMLVIQGHTWMLLFAEMKDENRIVILRNFTLGSTTTVLGIFQILAALRRLAEWIDHDYRLWFERMLGVL